MAVQSTSESWMQRALELAAQGQGFVEPNPMVGCVLVHDNQVIGEGFHCKFGGLHAEREAIADARQRGNSERLSECTAYVTLEPCCHHGKTPPCTDAILETRIPRVVVAMLDPFSEVSGQGCQRLRDAGVQVEVGVCETASRQLNAPYLKRVQQGVPWLIAKWAMSIDGRIATRTGQSKWITNSESRAEVHRLRSRVDGVLVGINTVLADDPLLNARSSDPVPRKAARIVVDSHLRLPLDSQLVTTASELPLVAASGPDVDAQKRRLLEAAGVEVLQIESPDANARLRELLNRLASEKQMTNILVEGGSQLLGSLFELGEVDQCEVYIAPKVIGGADAFSPVGGLGFEHVDDGPVFEVVQTRSFGSDFLISYQKSRQA